MQTCPLCAGCLRAKNLSEKDAVAIWYRFRPASSHPFDDREVWARPVPWHDPAADPHKSAAKRHHGAPVVADQAIFAAIQASVDAGKGIPSLSELAKATGYATCTVGKWRAEWARRRISSK